MSEATPASNGTELNGVLVEAERQHQLSKLEFHDIVTDADLLKLLQQARTMVISSPDRDPNASGQLFSVAHNDPEHGQVTTMVPRDFILTLAELYHRVRNLLSDHWTAEHAERPQLFHQVELPSAEVVGTLLSDRIPDDISPRVREYIGVALELMHSKVGFDIINANAPTPDMVQGSLHLNVKDARDIADEVLKGVQHRLQRLFSTPPAHIARSMREWRDWQPFIETATPSDAQEIHDLYGGVLIPREQLIKLDPRYADKEGFSHVADHVRNRGAMFKNLRELGGDNEVLEGLNHGRIAIVREKPNSDHLSDHRNLLGFYNVISDPDAVRAHMKRELHFSCSERYGSTADLPRFSRFEEPTGEKKTISYSDEEGALRIFTAATEGRLAWSVDHAVRMDGPEKIRRYAMLGTALKLNEYDFLRQENNKQFVLMKVATVIGADSSRAAQELSIEPVSPAVWKDESGECSWKLDSTGMVVLPRAIMNVGSTTLNTKLGAHEVFTMTEEFMREGVRVRILWRYLAQPLPPDIP